MPKMTTIRDEGVGTKALVSLAPASRPVEPATVRAGKDQGDENNVLPNLLLDVREGFLGAFRSVFRQFGVTDQQYRVLSILLLRGDQEISKLARHARIAAPSMTGILDRMTEIGWVTRKISKGQRWGVVSLTAAGRKMTMQLLPKAEVRFASFEAALGLEQLEMLGELLLKARSVLRDMVASGKETASTEESRLPGKRRSGKKRSKQVRPSGMRAKTRKSRS
jgi:DNA-binding MarR family transcriptional regulator